MAWSLEEKLLVVGTQDGILAVWDMEEKQVIHILTGHTGEAWEAGFMITFFLVFMSISQPPESLHHQFTSLYQNSGFVFASVSYRHVTKHPQT